MSLREESKRGEEARRLLENPLFREAIDGIKSAIVQKWQEAPIMDREGQHELKLMLKLANDFEANIIRVMNSGKVADFELESMRKRQELQDKVKRYA